jgi:hypothetical protein
MLCLARKSRRHDNTDPSLVGSKAVSRAVISIPACARAQDKRPQRQTDYRAHKNVRLGQAEQPKVIAATPCTPPAPWYGRKCEPRRQSQGDAQPGTRRDVAVMATPATFAVVTVIMRLRYGCNDHRVRSISSIHGDCFLSRDQTGRVQIQCLCPL